MGSQTPHDKITLQYYCKYFPSGSRKYNSQILLSTVSILPEPRNLECDVILTVQPYLRLVPISPAKLLFSPSAASVGTGIHLLRTLLRGIPMGFL